MSGFGVYCILFTAWKSHLIIIFIMSKNDKMKEFMENMPNPDAIFQSWWPFIIAGLAGVLYGFRWVNDCLVLFTRNTAKSPHVHRRSQANIEAVRLSVWVIFGVHPNIPIAWWRYRFLTGTKTNTVFLFCVHVFVLEPGFPFQRALRLLHLYSFSCWEADLITGNRCV